MDDRLDIARKWSAGFIAGITPSSWNDNESEHWKRGFSTGYATRKQKNELLNAYLESLGFLPMSTIHPLKVPL
jgi:hypothetical protein